jgi:ubiquitin-protein ligase
VSTGSGVPVRRPALLSASLDEKWWLDETSVDVARDESRVPKSAACPDPRSACALLTELFGCAVADGSADARSQAPEKKNNASAGIPIPFSKSGGAEDGAVSVSRRVVDAALASRVSPARSRGVESLPSTLAAVHFRAVAVESNTTNDDSDSWSSTLARLVRFACAEKLTRALEDDGDDLYFEGGRHRAAFFKDLGERASRRDAATDAHVALMLDDMLDVCETSEKARCAWLDVLRAAFGLAANAKLDAVDGLDVPVAAIGALFSRPRIVSAFRESLRAEALDALESTGISSTKESTSGLSGLSTRRSVLGSSRVSSVVSGSALGALLSRGALPNVLSRDGSSSSRRLSTKNLFDKNGGDACSLFTESLRGYPEKTPLGDREKLRLIMQRGTERTHDVAHACALRCVKLKSSSKSIARDSGSHSPGPGRKKIPDGAEIALAWLAATTTALEEDASSSTHTKTKTKTKTHGADAFLDPTSASDAFRLGVIALALRFVRPVVARAETHLRSKLCLFDSGLFSLRVNWRHDWRADQSLALPPRSRVTADHAHESRLHDETFANGSDSGSDVSFVHECFYASARLFQTVLPVLVTRFEEASRFLRDRAVAKGRARSNDDEEAASQTLLSDESKDRTQREHDAVARDAEYNAYVDCASAALLEPAFARDACGFALLQAEWLARLAATEDAHPEKTRTAFAFVPEGFVKAISLWVCFVLRSGKAEFLLQNAREGTDEGNFRASVASGTESHASPPLSVASLVRVACQLLSRPALCRHPTVSAALVEMLTCVLIGESGFKGGSGSGLGTRGSATHELLVSSVLSSREAKTLLAPALMRAYASLDAVENLDVDRDRFDKFHTRQLISRLLRELWRMDECVASVARLSDDAESAESSKEIENENENDVGVRPRKLFASFASCALGDLMYVLSDSLDRLASVAEIRVAHAKETTNDADKREATLRFVANQERTARGYLKNATETLLLLNLFAGSETVAPAFLNKGVVGKAAYAVVRFLETLLNEKGEAVSTTLGKEDAKKKYGFDRDALVLAICEFAVRVDAAARKRSDDDDAKKIFARALAKESDYDAATMERARGLLIEKTFGSAMLPPLLRDLIDRAETEKKAMKTEESAHVGGKIDSIRDDDAFDPDALLAALGPDLFAGDESREADAYKAAFSDGLRTFGETDDGLGLLAVAGDGSSCDFFPPFAALARENASSGQKAKAKKLAKEASAMASGALPLELGSSIFFRHDPDRLDVARVVITGPANTPYEGGAFAFDAFCPSGYPEHPPMVNLDTTGGGRARFNPNLYADGKVCLSLLGTWHGGAAEEKWDAKRSTLAQVFVSIQGLIFVDDPMFNEPGFDGLRGLKEGDEKSARYNAEIRLFTIRHAMIDALKKPRRGVGATVRTHFSIKKWSVMRRALRWCEEAENADPVILRRTREAAVELSRLLARLE